MQIRDESDHEKWDEIETWLRSADRLVTLVSTGEAYHFSFIPEDLRNYMYLRFDASKLTYQDIADPSRAEVLDFLRGIVIEPEALAMCFYPHHFIFGWKGSDWLVVNICFSCWRMNCHGAIESGASLDGREMVEANSFFGLDPSTDAIEVCATHYISPPAPRPTWPIGGAKN